MTQVPYGRRLLLHVLEQTARDEPDRPLFSIPNSPSDPRRGWRPLSFSQVVAAVDRTAHWLESHLGRPDPGPGSGYDRVVPTIAYVGLNDVRYFFLALAAIKVGYVAFFPSVRNNIEAIVSLFDETKVVKVVNGPEYQRLANTWLDAYPVGPALEIPSISHFLDPDDASPPQPYPYNETFESARYCPCIILHSSGTTGTPKAIVLRQGYFCTTDSFHKFANFNGYELLNLYQSRNSTCLFAPVPLFHGYGVLKALVDGIFFKVNTALGVPELPVTADTILQSLQHCNADAAALTPSMTDELVLYPGGLDALCKLRFIINAGGAASNVTIDLLRKHKIVFLNIIGATETGFLALYRQPNLDNYDYFIFNDAVNGAEYDHIEDGVYEQRIVRRPELDEHQGVFLTFPDKTEYRVGDMYEAHPTLPNHWRYRGRLDSIIVFSTGEKLNPVSMEEMVERHPEVHHALVVGRARFQAGIIIEPREWPARDENYDAAAAALIDRVWPQIEKANAETVQHGRVVRSLVRLAHPDKPFPLTAKGSVRRNVALKMHAQEIECMYKAHEANGDLDGPPVALGTASLEDMTASVRDIVQSVSGVSAGTVAAAATATYGDDDDLFLHGFDSLQALQASKRLTSGLSGLGITGTILPRDIYREKSIAQLSRYLFDRIRLGQDSANATNGGDYGPLSNAKSDTTEVQALIDKYTAGLCDNASQETDKRPPARTSNRTVVLTGSTGSLGSYVLNRLLEAEDVGKIICLNRALPTASTNGEGGGEGAPLARQLESYRSHGLPQPSDASLARVTFMHADLSRVDLGLSADQALLLRDADCIIHNAWPVNFNLTLSSFEGHIRGVRHLVDLARVTDRRTAIVFVSSIGSVIKWKKSHPVPEEFVPDLDLAGPGYGESKLVSERILHAAASSVPVSIIRLGQVAGPTTPTGEWNRKEWLPRMMETSVRLGVLPRCLASMEPIAWMPVDKVAQIVLDVADSLLQTPSAAGGARYFNLTNPRAVVWASLVPAVRDFYKRRLGRDMALVDLATWVEALRAVPPHDQARMPALKILDSFESMAAAGVKESDIAAAAKRETHATEKLQAISKTLAQLEPVTPELISLFCEQWNFSV